MTTPTAYPPMSPASSTRLILPALLIFFFAVVRGLATSVEPPEFRQLVNESDYIIRAVVKSITSEFRATSTGKGRKIISKVELEVREVVAGIPPEKVVLEILGGKVGDEEMRLEGAPQFNIGDEDILFVSGNGRSICPLVGIMYGRYPVLRAGVAGREYVARNNRIPLQDTAEVGWPMAGGAVAEMQRRMKDPAQAIGPGQFIQRVRSAVDPAYRRVSGR